MRRALAQALRAAGWDVLTTFEAGNDGLADEAQLAFATSQRWVIYTTNVGDYTRLHQHWIVEGRHHAGIIALSNQVTPVRAQIDALMNLASSVAADQMNDRLEFLLNWRRREE